MKAAIILFNVDLSIFNKSEYDLIIGADKGAFNAAACNIMLDYAIGDFDSTSEKEFMLVKKYAKNIIKLNPIKDESDTNEAIKLCKNCDSIDIYGGITGKRIEHFYANLIDLYNNPKLRIIDNNSLIESVSKNQKYIVRNAYKFISIYSFSNDTIITLRGFKYNLNNYKLKMNDPLGLSNEIKSNPEIILSEGRIIVFYSKGE